jgi:PAS domain S-box-containing protein
MRLWTIITISVGMLWHAALRAAEVPSGPGVLTNIISIIDLSAEQAAEELPVQMTAAVTYTDPSTGVLFVEDETGGISVTTRNPLPGFRRGERIEIRGRTDPGLHLNAIGHSIVQPAGQLQRLIPSRPDFGDILEGRFDCRLVEVRGVVRQIGSMRGRPSLSIETSHGPVFEASFLNLNRSNLWDATVIVRGVCGARRVKGNRNPVVLYCWSSESITVEKPGLPNPFEAPIRTLADLRGNRSDERMRVDGRVKHINPVGKIIVEDDTRESIEIQAQGSWLLQTNDRVQVSCVPDLSDGKLSLRHVELRVLASTRPQTTNAVSTLGPPAPLINKVASIRSLGNTASRGFPVRVRGTITYYDRAWMLFVQDETGGIYTRPGAQRAGLQAGQLVEVEGYTHAGDYAPIIDGSRIRIIGPLAPPPPKVALPETLFLGQNDSQRVEVSGVIYSVRRDNTNTAQLELGTSAGRITTTVLIEGPNLPMHLVDAEVRVRAVCGSTFNQRRQFTGPRLFVASTNDIIIERPAPTDPFAITRSLISTLLRFDSGWMHRVKVSGTVTLSDERFSTLCIEDETGGIFIHTEKPANVKLGDTVEAIGFPAASGYTPSLLAATVRTQGISRPLSPQEISFANGLSGTQDGKLVTIQARLLDRFVRGSNDVLVLKAGNISFEAHLPHGSDDTWWSRLEVRSMLKVTGVCVALVDAKSQPHAFKILLRSATDVTVSSKPAFWTDPRVRNVAICAFSLILVSGLWVAVLRRKVSEQTAIIREQLNREQRQNDELERKVSQRTMALSDANAALQKARDELELRVQQRTSELSSANASLRAEVAERQRSEQALRLSEERFSKAFRCSPVSMCISRLTDEQYVDVNDTCAQMLGFNREEMLGRTSVELGIWADGEDHARLLAMVREKKGVRNWQIKLCAKSGDIRHVHASAEMISVNGVDCILTIITDETERVILEEQLRQSQKMEAVGQLAAGIAHDFNNMLTIIQGHVCLMNICKSDPAAMEESVAEISSASERAAHLTRQLLTFSRRQPFMPQLIDLNDVISGMLQMLYRTIGEQIHLHFHPTPFPAGVQADRAMIEQVILNLAVNARDAMTDGGQLVFSTELMDVSPDYVRSRAEASAGQFVCVTATDTGCGMDAATLSRVFEPFFTTKEIGKGTGLGLATVYGTVKQHGGWVEVASEPGQGTTFKIFLPAMDGAPLTQTTDSGSTEVRGGGETILLVEDENGVRELARNVLNRYGYEVVCAGDSVEAMEVWREQRERIHLLLTDMVMPNGLSGRELAQQLRSERPDLKVIYSSGYSVELERHELGAEEGTNFLPKPYAAHKLASIVRDCLDH